MINALAGMNQFSCMILLSASQEIRQGVSHIHKKMFYYVSQGDEADEEEIYNVVQSLKRLSYLFMFNDLTGSTLYDTVNSVVQMYEERNDSVPEPVSCSIKHTTYLYHLHLFIPLDPFTGNCICTCSLS